MVDPADCPVLVVEDDEGDQLLIARAFAKARLINPVIFVSDGESAIAYLSRQGRWSAPDSAPRPGLVLLDLKLPGCSGFEVLEWLRAHPELKRTPVVVLTSSSENPDVRRAYDLHANSYLKKPVDTDSLLQMAKTLGFYWFVINQPPPPA